MDRLYMKLEDAYVSWVARRYFEGELNSNEVERHLQEIDSLRAEYLRER